MDVIYGWPLNLIVTNDDRTYFPISPHQVDEELPEEVQPGADGLHLPHHRLQRRQHGDRMRVAAGTLFNGKCYGLKHHKCFCFNLLL